MKILVLNSGSSSIKFKLFDGDTCVAGGLVEKIGEPSSYAKVKVEADGKVYDTHEQIVNHERGLEIVMDLFKQSGVLTSLEGLDGVGHRVVQGASVFKGSVLLDESSVKAIEDLIPLAPLHNPAHVAGMRSVMRLAPKVPNVAVFDTSFHQTMPEFVYRYALPKEFLTKYKVRRYGAHGTSHAYVSRKAAEVLGIALDKFNCITMHLGNGASVSAVKGGKCFDTSMGLTPLEGLMMGTRCGEIDPAVLPYMQREAGIDAIEMDTIMNKKSGLFAICGTNDMREVESKMEAGDADAKLAFDMFCYRIKKYLGAYYAALGHVDAVVFTAGIGENDNLVRAAVCENMTELGIELNLAENDIRRGEPRIISTPASRVKVLVVPTEEELAIAQETVALIKK